MKERKNKPPKIFVNTVPKSGTHLIIQIIRGVPSIYRERKYGGGHSNDVVLTVKEGEMLYSHVPYDPVFAAQLQEQEIKQVFLYRDPRDVALSMVYFINRDFHEHPLYLVFKNRKLNFEEQLNTVISGTELIGVERNNLWGKKHQFPGLYEEFKDIYEWHDKPGVCSLRFEDLVDGRTKDAAILKIIDFLWEDLSYLKMEKQGLLLQMKQNINPNKSNTFRKGTAGGWRNEFTAENKKLFKKKAGSLLIQLGYETDYTW